MHNTTTEMAECGCMDSTERCQWLRERNYALYELAEHEQIPPKRLGEIFGIPRPRVTQILGQVALEAERARSTRVRKAAAIKARERRRKKGFVFTMNGESYEARA